MALLHSFSYMQETDPRTWLLFTEMQDKGKKTDCSLEVIDAAGRGKIDLARVEEAAMEDRLGEVFSLSAYSYRVQHNRRLVAGSEGRSLRYIMDADGGDWEPYGVSEEDLPDMEGQEDEYDKLADEDEVLYAVREAGTLWGYILCEYRVDLWRCMRQALKGMPESIAMLRKLAEDFSYIGSMMQVILSSGKPLESLLPEG